MSNHIIVGTWTVKRGSFELMLNVGEDQSFWLADRFTDRMIVGKWAVELREANPLLVLMPISFGGSDDSSLSYIADHPQVEVWELKSFKDNGDVALSNGAMVAIPDADATSPTSVTAPVASASLPSRAAPQWPSGPRVPNLSQPTRPAAESPTQTDNAAVRQIYQNIDDADQKTTSDIAAAERKQSDAELKAQSDATSAMSDAIHDGVPRFIAAMRGIKS